MALEVEGLSKRFGQTIAASDVSLKMRDGAVHAIVGENGAGKSTLLNMLAGGLRPDSGNMSLNGKPYAPQSLADAAASGVALVHQEITINRSLSIAENVYISKLRDYANRFGGINLKQMANDAQAVLESLGVNISVSTSIDQLNLGELKCVEIARAISSAPRILLLDESTAYLDHREVKAVLNVMRRLKSKGMAIAFVSHHLQEVQEVADDMTILKDGQFVGSFRTEEITLSEIHHRMVGRDFSQGAYPPRPPQPSGDAPQAPVVFRAQDMAVGKELSELSFEIRRGEILGLAGLKGAGAEALFAGIAGDMRLSRGTMWLGERQYRPMSPRTSWQQGVAYLPGDRSNEGLIADFSVLDNLTMSKPPSRGPFFDRTSALSKSDALISQIGIRTASADAQCRSLSGGNMQKVVLGKCLAVDPELLLLNNPTRGVDVGARFDIYRLIRKKANEGLAIILSSEDMPELLGMSERLIVLRKGVVAHEFPSIDCVEEHDVARYMT